MAINSTSFTKTPQAGDDYYGWTEDQLLISQLLTGQVIVLDVMSNDLGGAAKSLYSIDDGNGNTLASDFELLVKDVGNGASAWELTGQGNWMRINNGKIEFKLDGSLSSLGALTVNSLGATDRIHDEFVYAIRLANGTLSQARVSINIEGSNDGPVITNAAAAAAGVVKEDAVLVATGQLSASDADHNATQLWSIAGSATGAYGNLAVDAATGRWIYTLANGSAAVQALAAGESHVESFVVRVTDDQGAFVEQTVRVTVGGTNDGPVLSGVAAGAVQEDVTTSVSGQLAATDVDAGDTQAWSIQGSAAGALGSLAVDSQGQWIYTLDNAAAQSLRAGESRAESFTVRVTDGQGASADKTVVVTVSGSNDGPTLSGAVTGAVQEDGVQSVSGQLAASDVDAGDSQSWSIQGAASGAYGSLAVDSHGQWTYTLDNAAAQSLRAGESRAESFTVRVTDGQGASADKTVVVTVGGSNDGPTLSGAVSGAVQEDVATSVSGQLAAADVDAGDTQTWSIQGAASGAYGSLAVDSHGQWTYTLDNAAAQSLRADESHSESFTVRVTDGQGAFAEQAVNIIVRGSNDGPVAIDDSGAAYNNEAKLFDVLANDTDVDSGDTKTLVSASVGAGQGSVSIVDGQVRFDPGHDFAGLHKDQTTDVLVSYTLQDGAGAQSTGSLVVTVIGTNTPPVATDANESVDEDGSLTAAFNASDAEDATLQYAITTGPQHGQLAINPDGTYTYTPDANYNGADSFSYSATDSSSETASANVSLTVNAVNDAPTTAGASVATDEDTPLDGQLAASDVDGDQPTFSLDAAAAAAHGTVQLAPNGSYTYVPDANYNGEDSFGYTVSDGQGGTATATVSITVNALNDAPVTAGASVATDEDTPLQGQLAASDVDGDAPIYSLGQTAANGTLQLAADGSYTYTPHANFNGADSFSYTVSDGHGGTATASVSITVNAVNDAPVAVNDSATVNEDAVLNLSAATLLANDTDVDAGDTRTLTSVGAAAHGSVVLSGGSITYTPVANYNGADSFTYTMKDAAGATSAATVSVTVNPVNDAPVATIAPLTYTGTEQTALSLKGNGLSVTDVDAGNGLLTVTLGVNTGVLNVAAGTSGATVSGSGSGTVTITGTAAQVNSLLNADATSTVSFIDLTNDAPGLNLVTNGSFESPDYVGTRTDGTTYVHYSIVNSAFGLAGWNQTGGSLVIADNTTNGWVASDGTQFIEIDTGFNGAEFQRIATTPGQQYLLTFDYAPDAAQTSPTADDRLAVSIDGVRRMTLDRDDTTLTTIDWSHESLLFTATGSSTEIRFADDFAVQGFTGPNLDNVRVVAVSPTLTMTVSDNGNSGSGGALTSSDSAAISLAGVNDAPVNTVPTTTLTVSEDSTGNSISGLGVKDADSADANISVQLSVLHGALTVINGFGYVSVAGNNTGTVTMTGTQAAINTVLTASSNVQYRPVGNYNGSDTLTMTSIDNGANGTDPGLSGTATNEQDIDTMAITVTSVNDAPVNGLTKGTSYVMFSGDDVASTAVQLGTTNTTIAGWFNWSGTGASTQYLMYNGNATSGHGVIGNVVNGQLQLSVLENGKPLAMVAADGLLAANEWHHVMVADVNSAMHLYIDGAERALTNATQLPSNPGTGSLSMIGGTTFASGQNFSGSIGEVIFASSGQAGTSMDTRGGMYGIAGPRAQASPTGASTKAVATPSSTTSARPPT